MRAIYFGVVHKDKGTDYGVSFPDFQGCVTACKTLEAAVKLGHGALALHIRGMIDDKEPLPEPTKADDLVNEDTPLTIFPAYVEVPKVKVKRFNIAAKDSDMKKINRYLNIGGRSRDRISLVSSVRIACECSSSVPVRNFVYPEMSARSRYPFILPHQAASLPLLLRHNVPRA